MHSSRISDIGDDILKRATSSVSFEDPILIKQLYQTYLGTRGSEGSLPARVPLRNRILSLLCKSKAACAFIPQSTQIVQEALAPTDDAPQSGQSSAVKQGLEATKLRSQVFAFTNWLARMSTPAEMNAFAPSLVGELQRYIEGQGWPRFNMDSSAPIMGELASRALGYESIGLLAGACPQKLLHGENLDLLRWLFTSLSEDFAGQEIPASIEQALSNVLGAMGNNMESGFQESLTSLLLHYMTSNSEGADPQVLKRTRYIVVRFANRCLPFSSTAARWINVLAMEGDANERSAVVEEGRKGLNPYWFRLLNPMKNDVPLKAESSGRAMYDLPDSPELINRFFGVHSVWNVSKVSPMTMENAYIPALTFCRCVFFHKALEAIDKLPVMDVEWERNIDALIANDEDCRVKLKAHLHDFSTNSKELSNTSQALNTYLKAAFNGLSFDNKENACRAGEHLLELASLSPNSTYYKLSTDISKLESPILSNNNMLRDKSSHIFGLLGSLKECSQVMIQKMLRTFEQKIQVWRQAIGRDALQVHGAILATTYFLSRSLARDNRPEDFDRMRSMLISTAVNILSDSRDKTLLDAIHLPISDLALFGVLTPESIPEPLGMSELAQKLAEKAKEGDEKAIMALGHLAIQCHEDEKGGASLSDIIEKLYELHSVRRPEAQFAVGAALSCAAIGWQSKSLVAALDVQCPTPSAPAHESTLSPVLTRVLSDCKSSRPALRQASVIWLLSLVQYCGHHHDVRTRLKECQVAFKGFLADRDSLNQESASRGLTLVYEKGDRNLKDELIRDLVGSFTDTKANLSGSVSQDTELFEPGALPTGDGSISTVRYF